MRDGLIKCIFIHTVQSKQTNVGLDLTNLIEPIRIWSSKIMAKTTNRT